MSLTITQLNKSFQAKTVARNINLNVSNGSITAILGTSGSGKSSLLNMIAGLLLPENGNIAINGVDITNMPPEQRQIAMMFQDFALLPHLNVWQNVAFGLRLRGVNKSKARQAAENILTEIGLNSMSERQISHLSGGEQQRVALARALLIEPKLLLLDEPFSNLDTNLRSQLQQQTRELVITRNIPALLVTHDPNEACLIADNIAILTNGQIIQYGKPNELLNRPISAEAAHLLGCLNVTEHRYIPQNAITFNANSSLAKSCTVCHQFCQPLHTRLIVNHPDWGELTLFVDNNLTINNDCYIAVDQSKIVWF